VWSVECGMWSVECGVHNEFLSLRMKVRVKHEEKCTSRNGEISNERMKEYGRGTIEVEVR
jgi:hypothetical protein